MSVEHAFLCSVQVRRTDKIHSEAAFHGIDEYMVHVEEWYQKQRMTHHIEKKRVFIATDDPTVIREARTKLVSTWNRLHQFLAIVSFYTYILRINCVPLIIYHIVV